MIQDDLTIIAKDLSLASPSALGGSFGSGHISPNHFQIDAIETGGRTQFLCVEFTESCDANCTIYALNSKQSVTPSIAALTAVDTKVPQQQQLLVASDHVDAGAKHYLPINPHGPDFFPQDWTPGAGLSGGSEDRWGKVWFAITCTGATTGKLNVFLTDAIQHRPRRFDAKNLT